MTHERPPASRFPTCTAAWGARLRRIGGASLLPPAVAAPVLAVPLAVAALALAVPSGLAAQDRSDPPVRPAPALPDAAAAGIDSVFRDLDRTDAPGCAVGVVVDGALAFADGYGSANLDHELPITPFTVFYMGSVSKQFTAGAVALAARQGHLSLDDDVREWFPELPDYGTTITVRHLVHHTSGIRDYLTLQGIAGSYGGATDEEIIELLARQRALNFPPGERELYSNSGYFLLSELVERATGMTLREYGEAEFFGPLGMRNSHFHDDADHIIRYRATGYGPDGDGFRMNHAWDFAQVGSGGLYSNVVDMARWEAAFVADAMAEPGLRADMLQPGILSSGDTLDYAFGLSHGTYRGVPTISHGGALAGFRSAVARFPEQGTAVVVLCNVTNANPMGRAMAVADLVLADDLGPRPTEDEEEGPEAEATEGPEAPAYDRAQLQEFTGRYHSPELAMEVGVVFQGERLVFDRPGGDRPLRPVEVDVFATPGARIRFQRDDGGTVTGFVMDAGRANGMVFERVGAAAGG